MELTSLLQEAQAPERTLVPLMSVESLETAKAMWLTRPPQINRDLARLLKWKKTVLLTNLAKDKSKHYSPIFLRKKGGTGKLRKIYNPDTLMRSVQFRILQLLDQIKVPDYIYAFEKGKSIPTMAQHHTGKSLVISIDLKDFFTSIKEIHLFTLFTLLGINQKPARTLSEMCTYKSFVPQGALTSPKVSNLITAATFGPQLKAYCDQMGYVLTIYADDITISSSQDLTQQEGRPIETILSFVSQLVRSFGFKINHEKTKVMHYSQRQYVCGAVVNVKVNLQKSERRILRAIVHNVSRHGVESESAKSGVTPEAFVAKIMGRLNWFSQLNPEAGGSLKVKFGEALQETKYTVGLSEDVKEIASSDTQTPLKAFATRGD